MFLCIIKVNDSDVFALDEDISLSNIPMQAACPMN
jgi:hypothetical protein